MAKTYSVRFCWMMPVIHTQEVEVPDEATPEQIVRAAHDAAESAGWDNQEDDYNGVGPTFVDDIESESENAESVEIPHDWTEQHVRFAEGRRQ